MYKELHMKDRGILKAIIVPVKGFVTKSTLQIERTY